MWDKSFACVARFWVPSEVVVAIMSNTSTNLSIFQKGHLRIQRIGLTVLLATLIGFIGLPSLLHGQAETRLTLVQLEQLIRVGAPDTAIAGEIHRRGVVFTPTPKILDDLERRGAGQTTLAAVRERMPVGTLEIQAPPESQVEIDGTHRGATDTQGRLVLPELLVGPHQLVVKKEGYLPGNFELTLAAHEYKRFPATLNWSGGFLTVVARVPGVSIDIERMGHFSDHVEDLPCLPGTYMIMVSGPKYQAATKMAEIVSGQHASVSFIMEPDPQFVRSAVAQIQQSFDSRNYSGAVSSAQELLSLDGKNKDALRLMAQSYFLTNEFEKFEATAKDVIDGGGSVQVQLNHHHSMGSGLHPVMLGLSAGLFSFDPETSDRAVCNYKAFTIPVAAILHVEATRNKNNEFYLNLKMSDAKNPKKVLNFNFTDLESHFVEAQKEGGGIISYTGQLLISRPEAQQALASMERLLKRVAPRAE
jgi:hypothetical protein